MTTSRSVTRASARGSAATTSLATSRPAAARRAARSCAAAAAAAASRGSMPLARNAATTPVRTSPVPAVASAGARPTWTSTPSPGAATSVSAPLSTHDAAEALGRAPDGLEPMRVDPARTPRRAAAPSSPACGVSTVGGVALERLELVAARRRRRPPAGRARRAAARTHAASPARGRARAPSASAGARSPPLAAPPSERPLDRLEQPRLDDGERLARRRDGDVARVGAERGLGGEADGAGHPGRAADDEHGAGRVLVVVRAAGRHEARASPAVTSRCRGLGRARGRCRRRRPRRRGSGPARRRARPSAVERDGHVRADGRAGDLAGRGVDAGREVDRDDRHAGRVHRLDQRGRLRARLAVEAGAEQRVDDHVGAARRPCVSSASRPASRRMRAAIRPSPPFEPPPHTAAIRRASGKRSQHLVGDRARRRAPSAPATSCPAPRPPASRPRCRAARSSSLGIGDDADRRRELARVRHREVDRARAEPLRPGARSGRRACTAGFGRPTISISFQVKRPTPKPSALPTASLPAKRPA